MQWWQVLSLIAGIACTIVGAYLFFTIESVTLGKNSGRLAAAVFAILGYYVLPTDFIGSPSSFWLQWSIPVIVGLVGLYYLVNTIRNYEGEVKDALKQNSRILLIVVLFIGGKAGFWGSGL